MTKFEVGKSYRYGDDGCLEVTGRTEKTITSGRARIGVEMIDGVEVTRKGGTREHRARADRPAIG